MLTTLPLVLQLLVLAALAAVYFRLRGAPVPTVTQPANLATRDDLQQLISRVDALRTSQATDVARLKGDVAQAGSLRQFQFEAELRTYEEIWALLVDVQRATESLRPTVDSMQMTSESMREARDRKRLSEFAAIFNNFTLFIQRRRPFFPPQLYLELQRLMALAHGDAIDIAHVREHQNPEYWNSARENADELSTQVDRIAEVIRDRLRLTGVA